MQAAMQSAREDLERISKNHSDQRNQGLRMGALSLYEVMTLRTLERSGLGETYRDCADGDKVDQ
jgi:hypothetical protein